MINGPRVYAQRTMFSKTFRYDQYYIDVAHLTASLSHDMRLKVGSVIVRDGQLVSQGWNGMPSGMPNNTRTNGTTNPEVIHSEANALMKLAKNGGGSNGATIYCTHSPCMDCALLILQSGIERVVYTDVYCNRSLEFMKERGLILVCIEPSDRLSDKQDKEGQLK